MDSNLVGFIAFLEKEDLLEFNIDGNEDKHFVNRLKLQKYVFLASRFGMPFRYQHSLYLYGPYSSNLATDYYSLARGKGGESEDAMPDEFREDDFLKSIRNDPDWLEIATTIIDRNNLKKERTSLIKDVCHIKSGFDRKFIVDVLADLERRNLVLV